MIDEKYLRIGISVDTSQQHIWQNGAYQNAIFLAAAFQRLPFVRSVTLVDVACGNVAAAPDTNIVRPLPLVTPQHAADVVDVLIELAGAFDPKWLELMRARGKKVVLYQARHSFTELAEPALFGRHAAARWGIRFDEIWTMTKDRPFESMMRTVHRCEVHEVPFMWHPEFVQQRARQLQAYGLEFGYGRQVQVAGTANSVRVAIFESNASVVRNASIPMLICDEAYRHDRTSVQAMHVLNSLHMKDHPTMLYLANSLDIVREHKATFHGFHDVVSFMPQFADAVVAHQWQNAQTYTALDVLYGDYPLVHNAEWMKEAGYYYPDFDVIEGARLLRQLAQDHSRTLTDYRSRSAKVFEQVDPFQPGTLAAYSARLLHLCRGERKGETV